MRIPEANPSGPERPGVVVRCANAFRPEMGRTVDTVEAPQTVRAWLDGQGIAEFDQPTICLFNGRALMRAEWPAVVIGCGDVCAFVALPHGGGGGGGKNPLRTVLSIALMVAGAWVGGMATTWMAGTLMGGAAGPLTAGQMLTAKIFGGLVGGLVSMGGNALLSALIPTAAPGSNIFSGGGGSIPESSPTYSLSSQGNAARLGGSIPCQYGRHQIYPDLISRGGWTYYEGNEQYLCQAHCLGLGEYDVEEIRINKTAIENFAEVTYEVYGPGETVTLFDVNVATAMEVSGQELFGPNELEAGESGYVGPFIANAVDTIAHTIGIDIVISTGLYYANNSGGLSNRTVEWEVEAREIDEFGDPVGAGAWVVLGSESITDATTTPIRRTYNYTLATPGRYEVRLIRINDADTSSRVGDTLTWSQLKAFVSGPDSYGEVSTLLVRMRATNNLSSQASRQINVIQTRKLPIWDAGTGAWSVPVATRSIVWALCDVARAQYGARLDDSRLPLAEMVALDATLAARGDTFDGIFDTKTTVWDALTKIARCGRAVPILRGGILRVFRDAPADVPVALFNARNIIKGSFSVAYIMPSEDTADAVEIGFYNQRTWKADTVTVALPDSAEESPASDTLFGATAAEHATREGEYLVACNRYRRVFPTFRTELDGMIPTYGDLIAVAHPMPRWSQGGEVVEWDPDTEVLTLSEPVRWVEGENHYIGLTKRDGSVVGPYLVEPGATAAQVHLLESIDITPYTGTQAERTRYSFGLVATWTRLCRVRALRPRSQGEQVEITAVVEDNRVHAN